MSELAHDPFPLHTADTALYERGAEKPPKSACDALQRNPIHRVKNPGDRADAARTSTVCSLASPVS